MGKRLVGNTLAQMIDKIGVSIIGLVLTPFIVNRVGLTEFGLWALVMNVVAYIALVDPGVSSMVLRYAARHKARNELSMVRQITLLGIVVYAVLGVVLAPFYLTIVPVISRHLHLQQQTVHLATTVFTLGYAYFFLSSAAGVLGSALAGLGDLWLSALIDVVSRAMYAVIVVILLLSGGTILAVVLASYIQAAVVFIFAYVVYRLRYGPVFASCFGMPRSRIRELLSFGGWVQLASVADIATTETDPLVIGAAFSVTDVSIYSFADTVAAQVQYLPVALINPLMAAATTAHEEGNTDQLRRLVVDGSRLLNFLCFGIGGLIVATGPEIFNAWLGHGYPRLEMFSDFLVAIYIVRNLASITTGVATAIGRPDIVAKNMVFGVVGNAIGTIALAILFGLPGVLAGSLLGVTCRSGFFQARFYSMTGLRLGADLLDWLWRLVVGVGVAAGLVRLITLGLPHVWLVGREGGLLSLVPLGILYGIMMILGVRLTKFLRSEDAALFSSYLPGPLRRLTNSAAGRFILGHQNFP